MSARALRNHLHSALTIGFSRSPCGFDGLDGLDGLDSLDGLGSLDVLVYVGSFACRCTRCTIVRTVLSPSASVVLDFCFCFQSVQYRTRS